MKSDLGIIAEKKFLREQQNFLKKCQQILSQIFHKIKLLHDSLNSEKKYKFERQQLKGKFERQHIQMISSGSAIKIFRAFVYISSKNISSIFS